ncbi:hypothetical protein FRC09_017861 [Ceratobasidium sp. 395]|nr:hypothetical protein FRC09_017861 [Ceratobasidium sp. 395]
MFTHASVAPNNITPTHPTNQWYGCLWTPLSPFPTPPTSAPLRVPSALHLRSDVPDPTGCRKGGIELNEEELDHHLTGLTNGNGNGNGIACETHSAPNGATLQSEEL